MIYFIAELLGFLVIAYTCTDFAARKPRLRWIFALAGLTTIFVANFLALHDLLELIN